MELGAATLGLYAAGATALATTLVKLKSRLQLSKAKHPSLTGHARMARRLASFIPSYSYDETTFFRCDAAPDEVLIR